ncbi:hypothetical protein BEWA_025080 [Theileria equi strain WA]|uniref:Uncharacterized protein n=1 Tax=Theileria equi strain WA TaxID=1537102 RepID=L0AXM3_THEEQ|nr:hypothetical protein BEWA_025080 [Theileria equi strain WA]AFZ79659.1 hypothetical protein BEWA_025080 [Theileria equi strain WA]|eukprot:XP_004829325.1 hypothetical protein BEWA_025080 [Theileria equi strain WA]
METSLNSYSHVVIVLDTCIINFTPVDRLEYEIFRICRELLDRGVTVVTIYNTDGLLNAYFSERYRKCNKKLVESLHYGGNEFDKRFYIRDFVEGLIQNKNIEGPLHRNTVSDDIGGSYVYHLEKSGHDILISSDVKDEQNKGLLLVITDKTHAHRKILSKSLCDHLNKRQKVVDENSEWICGNAKSGLTVEYKVPPDYDVIQPVIANTICTFGTVITSMPDLIISLRMNLKESLGYLLRNYKCSFYDLSMLISEIMTCISGIFSLDMTVVHPFGKEGIQPWFLSEAEIHERFGLSLQNVVDCIEIFNKSIRRWGK